MEWAFEELGWEELGKEELEEKVDKWVLQEGPQALS